MSYNYIVPISARVGPGLHYNASDILTLFNTNTKAFYIISTMTFSKGCITDAVVIIQFRITLRNALKYWPVIG